MKYVSNLLAPIGFALQPLRLKEQWEAAQRRTVVTLFRRKGARGMAVAMGHDEESFL